MFKIQYPNKILFDAGKTTDHSFKGQRWPSVKPFIQSPRVLPRERAKRYCGMKEGTHLAEGTGTDGRTSSPTLGHVHSQWSMSAPWECSHNHCKGLGAEAKP